MSQFLGEVVGTKMQRTVKVCVNNLQLHPVILKVIICLNLVCRHFIILNID